MNIQPAKVEVQLKNEDRVKEEKKKRAEPKTCPIKNTLWFITINSNIYLNDKSEQEANQIKKRFENSLEELLPSFDNFVEMGTSKLGLKYGYSAEDPREVLCSKDRILAAELKYVFELSPSGRLHAHILFRLKKRGVDTKISTKKIKEAVDKLMNGSCYVNYKLSACTQTLEDYMRKNPLEN